MEKLEQGIFILSLDVELKWGSFDNGKDLSPYHFERTRHYLNELLLLLERYKIPATFAVVGHLFLESCKPINGVKHPKIKRPHHVWWTKDWFSEDPCTTREQDPDWYGNDIVQRLREEYPRHEIGSHSFAHAIWGDRGCSREAAESDIKECLKWAHHQNTQLHSFVFPRNEVGHLNVLKQYGFSAYRGLDPTWFNRAKGGLRTLGHLIDYFLCLTPPCVAPQKTPEGLWNIPGSMVYLSRLGLRRYLPMSARVKKAQKGINRAIKSKTVFHLWFHPFNLCVDGERLLRGLEEIFHYAAQQRECGRLKVMTMGELALILEDKKEY